VLPPVIIEMATAKSVPLPAISSFVIVILIHNIVKW
jgi:hypothetical protein